ncbi:MAG: hypothetical protein IJ859_10545 [Synergistaceae bacterium]|nr:hypothetical protein [Synergistaceae bacterium]
MKIFLFTLIALLSSNCVAFSAISFNGSPVAGQKDYEFGMYNNQPLKWRVLEVDTDNKRALLVTEKAVIKKAYDDSSNVWLSSEVRTWLNGDFLNGLGDDKEKIIKVRLQDETYDETYTNLNYHKSSEVEWNASGDDADSVFLLSAADADYYFTDSNDRVCYLLTEPNDACFWWLRSPGFGGYCAAYVIAIGEIGYSGWDVDDNKYIAVRPAVWINLSSEETQKNNDISGGSGGCYLFKNFLIFSLLGFSMLIFKIKRFNY